MDIGIWYLIIFLVISPLLTPLARKLKIPKWLRITIVVGILVIFFGLLILLSARPF